MVDHREISEDMAVRKLVTAALSGTGMLRAVSPVSGSSFTMVSTSACVDSGVESAAASPVRKFMPSDTRRFISFLSGVGAFFSRVAPSPRRGSS